MDLREYSEHKIGKIWTAEDHAFIAYQLRKVEDLAASLWRAGGSK